MEKDKLISARASAILAMETAAKPENFNQADFDKAKKEVDSYTAQIEAFDLKAKFEKQTDDIIPIAGVKAIATAEYRSGFDAYLAGQEMSEFKAVMTEGVSEDGGYTVPITYQNTVLQKLNTLSRTRSISNVLTTTSTRNIPVEGDAPEFNWIDESGTYGETKSTFGNKQINAYKLGGIIKVSDELLNDTAISFEAYMSNQIAIGIDKAESPAFCLGDGSKKPTGYATGLIATTDTTTAGTAAITGAEVAKIYYALPEAYRARATWRMNTKTLQKIRELNDGNGVYFYKDEIKSSMTIEGKPVVIDENLPDMATGAKFLVFGDFNFYQIADRGTMEIRRLNEKYADSGLVGFRVTVRVDAKRMLDEAFVIGQNA
ncbi:phage major capsid protein [Aliarcobacter butzleri]